MYSVNKFHSFCRLDRLLFNLKKSCQKRHYNKISYIIFHKNSDFTDNSRERCTRPKKLGPESNIQLQHSLQDFFKFDNDLRNLQKQQICQPCI